MLAYRFVIVVLVCFGASLIASDAAARDYPAFGPLTIRDQNPIYLQTLGLTPTRATSLPLGSLELRADWAYSNIFEKQAGVTDEMDLDMELSRIALHAIYGLRDDLEVGIEVPMYTLWRGFLDEFIQSFHKFFGFPNGGRDRVPNNEYHYTFNSKGNLIYDVPSQPFMIGDISFRIKHHVVDETHAVPGVAWFAELKLPTGSHGRGTSNGSLDFGMGAAVEKSWKRLHGYLNVEYIVTGINNQLQDFMRSQMLVFAAAFEVTLLDSWAIIAQLNGGTPLLTGTGMSNWDGIPMDLIIGFRGEEKGLIGGHDLIWQAGFSEDVLSSGPSVDFTAFLSIGVRFHRNKNN